MGIQLFEIEQVSDEQIKAFKLEFNKNKEIIQGSNGLTTTRSISKWRKEILKLRKKSDKRRMEVHQYFIVDHSGELVGVIDFKSKLSPYSEREGGNIGYSIRKSERGHGYAEQALGKLLELIRSNYEIEKVLLTCESHNHHSRNIILSNDGRFNKTIIINNREIEHYWITL